MLSYQKTVFLISPKPVDAYPPVAAHAVVLSRRGVHVKLFTSPRDGDSQIQFSAPGVEIISNHTASSKPWVRRFELLRLIVRLSRDRVMRKTPVDLEIVYDPIGIWVSSKALGRAKKLIHHFHEILFDDSASHFERFARLAMPRADLVTVADSNRANLMKTISPAPRKVETVRNLPLKEHALVKSTPKKECFRAIYFGSFGDSQCLDTIVSSMPDWPDDVSLHCYGEPSQHFRDKMKETAVALGVDDRLHFEGWINADRLIDVASTYSVGFSMLRPLNNNWRFSAGASNKRYQIMCAGIPQITDDGLGVRELIQLNGVGACAAPDDPNAVAELICAYHANPDRVSREGNTARRLIVNSLNQETEFARILRFAGLGEN